MPLEDGKFSPNFDLAQFTYSRTALERGIDNSNPPLEVRRRLYELAWVLENVRAYLGGLPMVITSGWRGPELNRAVGGVSASDHLTGDAADFVCPAFGSPKAVCESLAQVTEPLGIGQLIYECIGRAAWVHLSQRRPANPANHIITIDDFGARVGILDKRTAR